MSLTAALLQRSSFPIAALLLLATLPAAAADEIKSKESELQQLNSRIESLRAELVDSERLREGLRADLKAVEEKISASVKALRSIGREIEVERERLRALEESRMEQRQHIDLQREALARQLRAAYAMGRQERLKIMLNQQDPAVISRALTYYEYFNRARRQSIGRINQVIAQLTATEAEIAKQERQLVAAREQQQKDKAVLESSRLAREPILAALSEEIEGKSQRLRRLEEDAKELTGIVERLQREKLELPMEIESGKPFAKLKGKLIWPAKGRLSARFGSSKAGNLRWEGVLISAREGEPVRAIHHGRVAFADWLRGFGLLMIIDHGEGYMTLYGHNESLLKDTGEWVEPGETIGTVGATGGRAQPGTYFGIRHNGRPMDPKHWCRRVKGNRVGRVIGSVKPLDVDA